jgi:hypothetical protein
MSKTLSEREYKNLIKKSKQGWAVFYKTQTECHDLISGQMFRIRMLEKSIEESDANQYERSQEVPRFITDEIKSLIGELKKEIECPICYEELKSDEIKFSSCGHKYCQDCLSKINECAICRKKIYHKK